MTEADRVEKLLDCAGRALGTQGAQRLLDLLSKCATLPDISVLVKATTPAASVAPRVNPVSAG